VIPGINTDYLRHYRRLVARYGGGFCVLIVKGEGAIYEPKS
jgi:hypothetical protein